MIASMPQTSDKHCDCIEYEPNHRFFKKSYLLAIIYGKSLKIICAPTPKSKHSPSATSNSNYAGIEVTIALFFVSPMIGIERIAGEGISF